jgi:N-acetylated-alpha-linked acidic dipeptidase
VTAQYVYVNFGHDCDYDDLQRANISVEGKIAIQKQEAMTGSEAIIAAQKHSVVGIIWYLDPQFDGEVTESHGYVPYPEGPARASDSVLRRYGVSSSLQKLDSSHQPETTLPVIPISFSEAVPLLQALNDYGPKPSNLGESWEGGQLEYRGVQYNTGPSPDGVVINLVNHVESKNVSAINVIGTIKGTIENEVAIPGNHRDAWAAGAGEPTSGSAALNEVIRSLGVAVKRGWKPRRTLIFASWDGHESGIWGSHLWLDANLPSLLNTTVAYIEVETAATGSEFYTKASPLLGDVIRDATAQVLSPNQTQPGQSVRHN